MKVIFILSDNHFFNAMETVLTKLKKMSKLIFMRNQQLATTMEKSN